MGNCVAYIMHTHHVSLPIIAAGQENKWRAGRPKNGIDQLLPWFELRGRGALLCFTTQNSRHLVDYFCFFLCFCLLLLILTELYAESGHIHTFFWFLLPRKKRQTERSEVYPQFRRSRREIGMLDPIVMKQRRRNGWMNPCETTGCPAKLKAGDYSTKSETK